MKILQFLNKCIFHFTVAMNDQYLITLWHYDLIAVLSLCFISFIRKRRLKDEVISFFYQKQFYFRIAILDFLYD